MVRKAAAEGIFYENDFTKLDHQIKSCFLSELGPGELPGKRRDKKLYGLIVPHAGYSFSGPCAAWAYKEIAESKLPSAIVIIGPNHSAIGPKAAVLSDDFETPFGRLKVDKSLVLELLEKCPFVKEDIKSHEEEHSIEVQLPFLQFVCMDKLKDIKILPLVVSNLSYEECLKISETLANYDPNILFIASSDFTHYGPGYNYVPFVYNVDKELEELDNQAFNLIHNFDGRSFFKYGQDKTICGLLPIIIVLEACKNLFAKKVNLLCYYRSTKIHHSENSVSYASFTIK
ncbi:AmmeMemoRadiSam system protein B [Candidatus Woesearchaeota archaeon]|nr:AmmeMemoRadiSam system protein B [Candidatus Woesearchaeota archaeon]